MGENRQAGAKMGGAHGAEHLAFIRLHLLRRCDFAERAPSLGACVVHQLVSEVGFLALGDLWRVRDERQVLIVAAGDHDRDGRTGRDGVERLEYLRVTPVDRRVHDTRKPVTGRRR